VEPESSDEHKTGVRILRWLALVLLSAAIYDGTIFYSRWTDKRDAQAARAARETENARKVSDMLGGDTLKILGFYVSPGIIRKGERATLCYGVNSAKTVQLDPPVEPVWPALTRCMEVSPRKDTEYKLTAQDAAGHQVSQTLTLQVAK